MVHLASTPLRCPARPGNNGRPSPAAELPEEREIRVCVWKQPCGHLRHKPAHRLGLVNKLTAPGQALAGALALAERIAANGPLAVAATKQIVGQQFDWQLAEVWEKQEPIMRPAFQSKDAREGALAFAEKRAPVWQGR